MKKPTKMSEPTVVMLIEQCANIQKCRVCVCVYIYIERERVHVKLVAFLNNSSYRNSRKFFEEKKRKRPERNSPKKKKKKITTVLAANFRKTTHRTLSSNVTERYPFLDSTDSKLISHVRSMCDFDHAICFEATPMERGRSSDCCV